MEKMPAESGPWTMGASKTCQVWPRSGEWKTRAVLPPVANQRLGSPSAAKAATFCEFAAARLESAPFPFVLEEGAEAPSFFVAPCVAEAPVCHGVDRIAMQLLLAAKAPSPSTAGGSCDGGMGCQV